MTELEKLEAGLEYCYDDPEVVARKENAIIQCQKYNAIDDSDYDAQYEQLKNMLGKIGNDSGHPGGLYRRRSGEEDKRYSG